jgi:hypothetical protein
LVKDKATVVYWNRDNKNEDRNDGNEYIAFETDKKYTKGLLKLIGYVRFRRFAKRILLDNDFSVIVTLQTLAALLLGGILTKHYSNRFIVDIRDYSYENLLVFRMIEKKIFACAMKKVISSEGFKAFLPEGDYLTVHNTRPLNEKDKTKIQNRSKNKQKLNIAYIGFVRYQEQFQKLLLRLKNDERFVLSFIGTRAMELSDFCKSNGIKNVILQDTFDDKDILQIYGNADIVNNLYGNHTPVLDYALSNKLYLSADLHMPILVCPDTFMETITKKYGIGLTVDLDCQDDLGDIIFNYYNALDWKKFAESCEEFNKQVKQEQNIFELELKNLLN